MSGTLNCPICGNPKCVWDAQNRYGFVCPECGNYRLDHWAYDDILSGKRRTENKLLFHKYASVLLERNLKGLNDGIALEYDGKGHLVFCATGESIDSYYPESYLEKFERGFFNIVRSLRHSPLWSFSLKGLGYNGHNLLFVEEQMTNPDLVLKRMMEIGWLAKTMGISPETINSYYITIDGLRHFEEMSRKVAPENAFLAMWFGVEDCDSYRRAVFDGAARAGYRLQVVDAEQYNGFIMDKVVNLIDDAPFIVADISAQPENDEPSSQYVMNGVRGGVYWEAGYARGQKKQVILTCRGDIESRRRVHFDLAQYNQIIWHNQDGIIVDRYGNDLSEVIFQRIVATVGKGQYRNG